MFTLIAGPCTLEDDGLNVEVAQEVAKQAGCDVYFKGSFDKANRSKLCAPRGPGIVAGMNHLARVKAETGLKVTTDVHEPFQAGMVSDVVDLIQIPAFLCRQTDLLTATGRSGCTVNVKKGQWATPEDMAEVVDKLGEAPGVMVTERGTSFGYGDLVVDMRAFRRIKEATGCPVIFDATHSTMPEHTKDLAPADGSRMLPLGDLGEVVRAALEVRAAIT